MAQLEVPRSAIEAVLKEHSRDLSYTDVHLLKSGKFDEVAARMRSELATFYRLQLLMIVLYSVPTLVIFSTPAVGLLVIASHLLAACLVDRIHQL